MKKWIRVTRGMPCPICGKDHWCAISEDRTAVLCPRTPFGSDGWKGSGGGGYLHRLTDETVSRYRDIPAKVEADEPPPAPEEFGRLAKLWHDNLDAKQFEMFAKHLGLDMTSLHRLRLGWNGESWSWPRRNAQRDIVGISLRSPRGAKFCVRGSRDGLFIPFSFHEGMNRILICEGPTDTAAMLMLGFDAIGRLSCTQTIETATEFCKGFDVVIVADNDEKGQGWAGAQTLAGAMISSAASVRIIVPSNAKDAREWKKNGITRTAVEAVISQAIPIQKRQQYKRRVAA